MSESPATDCKSRTGSPDSDMSAKETKVEDKNDGNGNKRSSQTPERRRRRSRSRERDEKVRERSRDRERRRSRDRRDNRDREKRRHRSRSRERGRRERSRERQRRRDRSGSRDRRRNRSRSPIRDRRRREPQKPKPPTTIFKRTAEPSTSEESSKLNQNERNWSTRIAAVTADDSQRSKFEKLLGMHKKDGGAELKPVDKKEVQNIKSNLQKMTNDLGQQYEQGLQFGFGKRRFGL